MGTALGTTGLTVPSLLWNELVYALGGSIANVMLWWFPYALAAGIGLLLGSMALSMARSTWRVTAMEAYKDQQRIWAARQRKKIWEPLFARAFRNPSGRDLNDGLTGPRRIIREGERGSVGSEVAYRAIGEGNGDNVPASYGITVAGVSRPISLEETSGGDLNPQDELPSAEGDDVRIAGGRDVPENGESPTDEVGADEQLRDSTDRLAPHQSTEVEEADEYDGPATTEDVENVLGNYPDAKTRMKILLRQGEPREPTPEELTEERIAILSAPLEA
jgi:hypothetical protein